MTSKYLEYTPDHSSITHINTIRHFSHFAKARQVSISITVKHDFVDNSFFSQANYHTDV